MNSKNLLLIVVVFLTAGCSKVGVVDLVSNPDDDRAPDVAVSKEEVANTPNAVPKYEVPCRTGNPSSYTVFGVKYKPLKSADGFKQKGIASWYGQKFHGRKTSCGEPYDMYAMTAAHKTLPLPSYVEVTNLDNNKKVVVRVNDRGPFHEGRIIDLSYVAAIKLGYQGKGVAPVKIRVVQAGESFSGNNKPEVKKSVGTIMLQAGAFASEDNARDLQGQLINILSSELDISVSMNTQGTLHLVKIGGFVSKDAANLVIDKVVNAGFNKPFITK